MYSIVQLQIVTNIKYHKQCIYLLTPPPHLCALPLPLLKGPHIWFDGLMPKYNLVYIHAPFPPKFS